MPSRRRVLATIGTTLLAGCGTTAPGTQTSTTRTTTGTDTSTLTTTSTTNDTSTTSAETTTPTPTLETITATRSFEYLLAGVHPAGYTSPDTTFVFARVGGEVDPDEYALNVGDIEHPTRRRVGGRSVPSLREGVPDGEGTLLAFAIEGAVAPADATIHGPDGSTALPEAAREFLRHPPSITATGFQVPDRATRGSTATVTVTLRNDGGTTGTFRGNLGSTGLSGQPVRTIDVSPDSTRTEEYIVSLYEDGETETIRLHWGVDTEERTIELTD